MITICCEVPAAHLFFANVLSSSLRMYILPGRQDHPAGDRVTPTFRNSYAAADSDAVTITLQKNLTGRALNAGEFTFKLSCPEDAAHNGLTATNDASGKVTFALTYKDLDPTKSDAAPPPTPTRYGSRNRSMKGGSSRRTAANSCAGRQSIFQPMSTP